ncbi:MAG: chloramphenicol acetyltransferase [Bacteroidia bacterium]|nr:chloramphenicol acetyltransferase [Bacteroidia bacterium]
MTNYKAVNINTWPRKNSYQFFKDFDDPYFNFTVNLKVDGLIKICKSEGSSFFLNMLHLSLKVANNIENFKMRYEDQQLVLFDRIDGGSTVLYDDESFGFAYYKYYPDRLTFIMEAVKEIESRKKSKIFEPNMEGQKSNLIYFSSIPWFSFTSTKHAQHQSINKSIPRITTGKYFVQNGNTVLPFSIEANHAIMDGYHMGLFFQQFESESK